MPTTQASNIRSIAKYKRFRRRSGGFFLDRAKRFQAFEGPLRQLPRGGGPVLQRAEQLAGPGVVDGEEREEKLRVRHRRVRRAGVPDEVAAGVVDLPPARQPLGVVREDEPLEGLLGLAVALAAAAADALR